MDRSSEQTAWKTSAPPRAFPRLAAIAVVLLAAVATLGGIWGGPALGDHEAIVAQCARNMRVGGDWIVPQFRESPFLRKPPLSYWLVAGASYLFDDDPATGLPVTVTAARLPSALAAFGTVLLLWQLASSMFGIRVGLVTAVVASTNFFTLLYAPNATAEMLLTSCCTWAYAHFWYAYTSAFRTRRGLVHLLMFYVALGVGMLAKGPAPLAMVAVPLAVWWLGHQALRVLASRNENALRIAARVLVRSMRRQTIRAFTRLWVIPGVFVFLGVFVPWMIAASREHSYAWNLWNWQYLQRFQGDYEDTRHRGPLYFVPIVLGLLAPWTLSLFEGLAAPWMRRLGKKRRALFYAGVWGVVGVIVMSLMEFKKPYYVAPAIPGLILITSFAVDRFFSNMPRPRLVPTLVLISMTIAMAVAIVWNQKHLAEQLPTQAMKLTVVEIGLAFCLLIAGLLYVLRYCWLSMVTLAMTMVTGFTVVWYSVGPAIGSIHRVAKLDGALDDAGVPADAILYWADQRPDARLGFYFGRRSAQLVDPSEVVTHMVDRTGKGAKAAVAAMVVERARAVLARSEPGYLILDREHLPLLKREAGTGIDRARVLVEIDVDGVPDRDDWIVLTNISPQ